MSFADAGAHSNTAIAYRGRHFSHASPLREYRSEVLILAHANTASESMYILICHRIFSTQCHEKHHRFAATSKFLTVIESHLPEVLK